MGFVKSIVMRDLQCAEHVEVIGDDADGRVVSGNELLAVDDILLGGFRLGFLKDAAFLNAMCLQIIAMPCASGNGSFAPLPPETMQMVSGLFRR